MNAVFIRPPKVAGASIGAALGIREYTTMEHIKNSFVQSGVLCFGHIDYAMLVAQGYVSQEFDSSAFKFAFVRNPYDRAVSWFFFEQARGNVLESTSFLTFCQKRLANAEGWSKYNPQVRWLENVKLDFLGRYERLQVDVHRVAAMLQVTPRQLPIIHWTEHDHYAAYYCAESAAIVYLTYKEDFHSFGYPINLPGV